MMNCFGTVVLLLIWHMAYTAPCLAASSLTSHPVAPSRIGSPVEGNIFKTRIPFKAAKLEGDAIEPPGAPHTDASALDPVLEGDFDDFQGAYPEPDLIPDPLEPVNRVFFQFNDRLYFWVVKPAATQYNRLFSEPVRVKIRKVFVNLRMPIRAVNCLLQGKIRGVGTELARFVINSTIGFYGFDDPARRRFGLRPRDEDMGQTLGFFGLGPGIYLNLPFFGPSSIRGTVGSVADGFLDPVNYLVTPVGYNLAVKGYDRLNKASLMLGEYESLKKAALEPYVSLREAYHQNRQHEIKE